MSESRLSVHQSASQVESTMDNDFGGGQEDGERQVVYENPFCGGDGGPAGMVAGRDAAANKKPAPAPQRRAPLPPDPTVVWLEYIDSSSNEAYYVNTTTSETTWDRPSGRKVVIRRGAATQGGAEERPVRSADVKK